MSKIPISDALDFFRVYVDLRDLDSGRKETDCNITLHFAILRYNHNINFAILR
jgi:hypothetical protein